MTNLRLTLTLAVALLLANAAPAGAAITRGWAFTGSLSVGRYYHASVLLNSGEVLVAGGSTGHGLTRSAELYNPATRTWRPAASMELPRAQLDLVKLQDGRVLAIGGDDGRPGTPPSTAELYTPETNSWQRMPDLLAERRFPAVTLLGNGQVLVAGGSTSTGGLQSTADIFNPVSLSWLPAGTMPEPRTVALAVPLPRNGALVAGGVNTTALSTSAIYDPTVPGNPWSSVPAQPRRGFGLTSLPNGGAIATGGDTPVPTSSVDIYDPVKREWTQSPAMIGNHYFHTATALGNGGVLVAGGTSGNADSLEAELFNPATKQWSPAGRLNVARLEHTATRLTDGRVLVTGGGDTDANRGTSELWTPTTSLAVDAGLAFGERPTGVSSVLNLQIVNTGTQPLFLDDFAVGGEFGVNADRCRAPIAPGGACVLDVAFAPAGVGPRLATLTFDDNTATDGHAVALSGVGVLPPAADTDGDGSVDGADRCPVLAGPTARNGCPTGLLNDPSIRYRAGKRGLRVIAYYVKATTKARVTVSCSKHACKRTVTHGRGKRRVRISRLNHHRLTNGTHVTITVTMPGRLTTRVVDRVSRGRRIEGRPRCTVPGSTTVVGC